MLDGALDTIGDLRINNCSQCLTSSGIVEVDLWFTQGGEATPHGCDIEVTHHEGNYPETRWKLCLSRWEINKQ
jgi:hypothetical protein